MQVFTACSAADVLNTDPFPGNKIEDFAFNGFHLQNTHVFPTSAQLSGEECGLAKFHNTGVYTQSCYLQGME